MRILLVHNRYRYTGGEDVVFANESRLLRDAGHEVVEYVDDNARIAGMNPIRLGLETIWSAPARRKLAAVTQEFKPDVAHFHNIFPLISPSAYAPCRQAGVPVIQTLHNYRLLCPAAGFFRDGHVCEECLDHGLLRGVRHRCYRNSLPATATVAAMLTVHRARNTWKRMVDRFIALSEFSRSKFVAGGLPADKISVKPNFPLADPGKPLALRRHALVLGHLAAYKGLATLLSAMRLARNNVVVNVIGDGPFYQDIARAVTEHSLSNIRLRGALPHEQAIEELRSANFLIFPSELFENFPMSIVEAFACGVPVIASRLGAMAEIVEDGRTGLHFHPGDANDLAARIEWAWEHPAEMAAMGKNARAEYEAKYTAKRNYELLMEIYESVRSARGFSPSKIGLPKETAATTS